MIGRRVRVGTVAAVIFASVLGTTGVRSQNFPNRPVQVIIPFAAGGSADALLRIIGDQLRKVWNQQLVLIARPGASGIIGTEAAARSRPDGYTLYLASSGPVSVNPSLFAKLPYEWHRDFQPVSLIAKLNQVLVVNPALPAHNLSEFIALARRMPGRLNYASMGEGSSQHLAAELFKSLAQVDLTHIPYRGSPQATTALLSGEVSVYFVGESTPAPYVKMGQLRALATTSKQRSAMYPEVPPISEIVPGYETDIWFGIFAPAGLPDDILRKLNNDFADALKESDVRDRLGAMGFSVQSNSPEEFRAFVEKDQELWTDLLRKIGTTQR